jgi:hypothetical protein
MTALKAGGYFHNFSGNLMKDSSSIGVEAEEHQWYFIGHTSNNFGKAWRSRVRTSGWKDLEVQHNWGLGPCSPSVS